MYSAIIALNALWKYSNRTDAYLCCTIPEYARVTVKSGMLTKCNNGIIKYYF